MFASGVQELLPSHLDVLAKELGLNLPHVEAARTRSQELLSALRPLVADRVPTDAALVVFGSLARGEMTQGSDLDWALLVDGQASPKHQEAAVDLQRYLKKLGAELKFNEPNPSGAFGGLAFSHDLVHAIGGPGDTNGNLTLRMLMLLEVAPLAGDAVLERVRTTLLMRYFAEENFSERRLRQREHTPRFLLNDMVRFWRTIAVDYAAKLSARGEEKWALRNTKLRFSRKLLFAVSLLIAYELELNPTEDDLLNGDGRTLPLAESVLEVIGLSPLDLLARAVGRSVREQWLEPTAARQLFQAYDTFLGWLDDQQKREHLAKLSSDAVEGDELFATVRENSRVFQTALSSLFLAKQGKIAELTHRYAIF